MTLLSTLHPNSTLLHSIRWCLGISMNQPDLERTCATSLNLR